jgi:hypothetical protein
VTEAEWLACGDPEAMLRLIKQRRTMRRQTKQRKQRLFSVACCRRIWPLIANVEGRRCVEVAERFADNQATNEELGAAEAKANAIWREDAADGARFACLRLCGKEVDGLFVSTMTLSAVFKRHQSETNKPFDPLDAHRRGACPSEEHEQCSLIRDIFGNPFRKVTVDPTWFTSTVLALAAQMYDSRDFTPMPILADALQDASCDSADILEHCRGDGPHVRGCWVVDLVLCKE